ncbi:MAG: hypothetical protein KTR32_21520 [Granulosicoccus sp.]|nr:hypothetical protein [Granulosicoccus sp.]
MFYLALTGPFRLNFKCKVIIVDLSAEFLGWQCRIRQHAVRKQNGMPPPGIKASVKIDGEFAGQINTIMNKKEPEDVIAEFRFMVQKTVDPKKIHENAIKYLSEYYYQYPREFDEMLTALFALDSEVADRMLQANVMELSFVQANQKYVLKCNAVLCNTDSNPYQATYWHNHLFNPNLPGVVKILGFNVEWANSTSEQIPTGGRSGQPGRETPPMVDSGYLN